METIEEKILKLTSMKEAEKIAKYMEDMIWSLSIYNIKSMVKYLSPKKRIKITKSRHIKDGLQGMITIGRPNYREKKFISLCIRAKEPFPIRKIQYKFFKKVKK